MEADQLHHEGVSVGRLNCLVECLCADRCTAAHDRLCNGDPGRLVVEPFDVVAGTSLQEGRRVVGKERVLYLWQRSAHECHWPLLTPSHVLQDRSELANFAVVAALEFVEGDQKACAMAGKHVAQRAQNAAELERCIGLGRGFELHLEPGCADAPYASLRIVDDLAERVAAAAFKALDQPRSGRSLRQCQPAAPSSLILDSVQHHSLPRPSPADQQCRVVRVRRSGLQCVVEIGEEVVAACQNWRCCPEGGSEWVPDGHVSLPRSLVLLQPLRFLRPLAFSAARSRVEPGQRLAQASAAGLC